MTVPASISVPAGVAIPASVAIPVSTAIAIATLRHILGQTGTLCVFITHFVELGSKQILQGMVRKTLGAEVAVLSVDADQGGVA